MIFDKDKKVIMKPQQKKIVQEKNVKEPIKPKTTSKATPKTEKSDTPLKKIEVKKINLNRISLTPLKNKKSEELSHHMRSKSMTDIDIKDQTDFDQWNISEKMKNEILKKYQNLESQVKIVMLKEKEINSLRKGMEKRSTAINEFVKEKNKFKAEIKEDKVIKKKKLSEDS